MATAPENNSADTFLPSLTRCHQGRRGRSLTCLSMRDMHGNRNRVLTKYFTMKRRYCKGLWNDCETISGVYQTKVIIKVFCLGVKTNDGMLREFLPVTVTGTLGFGCCHRMINGTLFLFSFAFCCFVSPTDGKVFQAPLFSESLRLPGWQVL